MIRTSSTATDGGIGIKMISQISVQNPKDPIKPYSSSSLLELSSVRSMTTYLLGKAPLLFFLNPPSHCFHIHHQGGWPYYGDRIHQRCFIEQKATSLLCDDIVQRAELPLDLFLKMVAHMMDHIQV